jgi:hypothetical protein
MRKEKLIELRELAVHGHHEPEAYIVEKYDDGTEVCIDILTKEINHSWPHCRKDGDTVVFIRMPEGMKPRSQQVECKFDPNKPPTPPLSLDPDVKHRMKIW